MIKKLRRKFIIIAMSSVFAVLALIIAVINVVNYYNVGSDADEVIQIIANNNGDMPDTVDHFRYDEALYTTRFFTVAISDAGEVLYSNTKYVSAINAEEAQRYALELYGKNKTSGYYGDYRYAALNADIVFYTPDKTVSYTVTDATMYIFLDCSESRDAFYTFLWVSILISIAGMLVVFVLVYFLSKLAVRPIAQSYEKQKMFITDAGHELKTPLTIIDANTEVLEMTEGENEWTQSIRNQVKRLTVMTQNLVYLARMEENDGKVQMTEFSLSDAVTEAAQPFKTLADTRGKTLKIDAESNLSYNGNEGEIRQLVSVLLDNAIKYSDENGKIEVTLKATNKGKELCVKNTVASIEEGKHDELFDRFYRSDKSHNSETGGHGIGLSIAKAVAEHHNGKITARSDDGRSLTITAVL